MSQEIWIIGASRRGYFSLFNLNLRCPKRYRLLVHQEGDMVEIRRAALLRNIGTLKRDLRVVKKGLNYA